ncbi:MAG: hypothetical protein ACYC61_19730 [Isosphaeraceae bacterium]
MEHLHEMLVQDEILFCGLVMLVGVVGGALARLAAGLRRRTIV